MIPALARHLRRFGRSETGTATVEFVLIFPVYLALIIMSIELSLITLRATMLERGLDIAVRDIRLGTGTSPSHDSIRDRICEQAIILSNCQENLRLEMVPTDIRDLGSLSDEVQCTDRAEEARPVLGFPAGKTNQLMLLRACMKYDPIFPAWTLASKLNKDDSGQIAMVSISAFVQEPL